MWTNWNRLLLITFQCQLSRFHLSTCYLQIVQIKISSQCCLRKRLNRTIIHKQYHVVADLKNYIMLTSSDVPAQVLYTLQCISWIFRQSEDIGWQTSFNKGEVSKTNATGNVTKTLSSKEIWLTWKVSVDYERFEKLGHTDSWKNPLASSRKMIFGQRGVTEWTVVKMFPQ